MASSLARSRALINRLRSKLGIISVFNHHNYFSSSKNFLANPVFAPQILTNPVVISRNLPTFFVSQHFESTKAQKKLDSAYAYAENQVSFVN